MKNILVYLVIVALSSQSLVSALPQPMLAMNSVPTTDPMAALGMIVGFLSGSLLPGSLLTGVIVSATQFAGVVMPDITPCEGSCNFTDQLLYFLGYLLGIPIAIITQENFVTNFAETAVIQCQC